MERLVIIDGNAILHRAFHAMPPLANSSGEMVNAVYGFASMIFKIRDDLTPSYMACTFDLPAPTFRKKIFTDYQIQRPVMDKDLSGQIEKVKEMVRVLGVPIYEMAGFEADDVIGTLAFQAKVPKIKDKKSKIKNTNQNSKRESNKEIEVVIVTGDRDILQLVDDCTKVYMPVKGLSETMMYDKVKVIEKFGLAPELIPDYKGLVGDQSDNYPGVAGIGPKTAVDLLIKYGDFKGIYRKLEEVKGGVKEKLEKGRESGEMSHKLATIMREVPITLDLENCRVKDFDNEKVREFFEKMEFRSLIKRLKVTSDKAQVTSSKKVEEDKEQMSLF